MDDPAARGDAIPLFTRGHRREHLTSHLGDQRTEGLLHVLHLVVLVVRPLPVEAKHGNPPLVHDPRIDVAVAVVVGDLLATSRESDGRAVEAAVVALELRAVSTRTRIAVNAAHESIGWLRKPSPHFDMVAAWKIELLVVQPPGHVDV